MLPVFGVCSVQVELICYCDQLFFVGWVLLGYYVGKNHLQFASVAQCFQLPPRLFETVEELYYALV